MENTSFISMSRQAAMRRQMDVIANNIANANTTGFKAERVLFTEFMEKMRHVERFEGSNEISFTQDIGVFRDTDQGTLATTDNPLNFAIQGEGYFVIETPQGERYTRNGIFSLNADGEIVTDQGYPVLSDGNAPLVITEADATINVSRDGTVSADTGLVGRFQIVNFENEQQLRKVANGLYNTDEAPEPVEQPEILQGQIEQSNVTPVIELTRMIQLLREFEGVNQMMERENERSLKAMDKLSGARAQ